MTDNPQRTDQWIADRLGKATGSRIADVAATTKSGWGASRANYMAELIAERLTGTPAVAYSNAAMQWGTEQEPFARAMYEFITDSTVELVGFIDHPKIAMSGASPDGLIGEAGLVEIKCPQTSAHIDTLLGGIIDKKYITQMQYQMAVTGRQWCDFCSFDPRMPPSMQLFVQRVQRDDERIKELEKIVADFLVELDGKVKALQAKYPMPKSEAA